MKAGGSAIQDHPPETALPPLNAVEGSMPVVPADVTPFAAPVPMRASGVINPLSIAGGLPGAYAPGEPGPPKSLSW